MAHISAMNWKVHNDTQRGYNFHYDDLSRITAADYQNNDVNSSKNYSTTYAYDNMGNIKSLTRYGLSAKPSTFGMINNLTLNYNGNQLSSVTDASSSEPSYTGAFNFVKASVGTPEYTYDANGNLIRDSNKKIAKIQYNILNLPSALQFTEGHTSEYLYDAAGIKRKVKQVTTTENLLVPMGSMLPVPADKVAVTTQTDYCGNVIYENGTLSRILVDGGYITMSGTAPTYHYYIQDHLGNNRVVFNQSGTVEQANHYYPFGMTFGEGIDNSDNRYKYNGKELDRMHGLDWYDYGARMQTGMNFTTPDPLAEKYYSISPYAYCANNPIRFIDPDGRDWFVNNATGEIYYHKQLRSINSDYAKKNGLGKASDWQRIGADAAFDTKKNKLSNMETMYMSNESAEGFMGEYGYKKAEQVSVKEDLTQSWEPHEPGVGTVTYSYYDLEQIGKSKITYVKPWQLNQKSNVWKKVNKYEYTNFETVKYNLIKPFGQSNNRTSYYLENKKVEYFNTGLSGIQLLIDLLKLIKK